MAVQQPARGKRQTLIWPGGWRLQRKTICARKRQMRGQRVCLINRRNHRVRPGWQKQSCRGRGALAAPGNMACSFCSQVWGQGQKPPLPSETLPCLAGACADPCGRQKSKKKARAQRPWQSKKMRERWHSHSVKTSGQSRLFGAYSAPNTKYKALAGECLQTIVTIGNVFAARYGKLSAVCRQTVCDACSLP